ncbi:MAG: AI-2E family transporter, partial [Pseudomonadota bacterium]
MNISDNAYRIAIVILAIISGFGALSIAQNVFAPTLTAIVIGVVFSPLANVAERLGAPRVVIAVAVLAIGLLFIGTAYVLLEGPVRELIEEAPRIWTTLERQAAEMRNLFAGLAQISSDISDAVDGGTGGETVVSDSSNQLLAALTFAPLALAQVVIFIGALFFFILSRREIYGAVARLGTSPVG